MGKLFSDSMLFENEGEVGITFLYFCYEAEKFTGG